MSKVPRDCRAYIPVYIHMPCSYHPSIPILCPQPATHIASTLNNPPTSMQDDPDMHSSVARSQWE